MVWVNPFDTIYMRAGLVLMVPGLCFVHLNGPIKMICVRMVAGLGIQMKKCNETSNQFKTVLENR